LTLTQIYNKENWESFGENDFFCHNTYGSLGLISFIKAMNGFSVQSNLDMDMVESGHSVSLWPKIDMNYKQMITNYSQKSTK